MRYSEMEVTQPDTGMGNAWPIGCLAAVRVCTDTLKVVCGPLLATVAQRYPEQSGHIPCGYSEQPGSLDVGACRQVWVTLLATKVLLIHCLAHLGGCPS